MSRIDDILFSTIDERNTVLRHKAKYNGQDVIVIGFNPRFIDCLVVALDKLPDDKQDLLTIVESNAAQQQFYLVTLLQALPHKSGKDWFSYLAYMLKDGSGRVMMVELDLIEDLNEQQREAYIKKI